jgi:hypothetical protein
MGKVTNQRGLNKPQWMQRLVLAPINFPQLGHGIEAWRKAGRLFIPFPVAVCLAPEYYKGLTAAGQGIKPSLISHKVYNSAYCGPV